MRFRDWCVKRGAQPFPVAPAIVAGFIGDCCKVGLDALVQEITEISSAHNSIGLADPTRSDIVLDALGGIVEVEAPRSWPKEHRLKFWRLPYDLQLYLAERERDREAAIRRALNEAGEARKELAALKKETA